MVIPIWRIRQLATGAAASVVFGAAASNLLRLASNLTLTRLVTPEAFGITAIIASIQFVISLMADVGFYDFIVQHKDGDDPTFQDEVWSIRLIRGFGLTIVTLLLAFPIAAALHKPVIGPVIALWSFAFVADGVSSLSWATGVRHQQFWRLTFTDFGANVIGTVSSVVLAMIFHNYWALIAGMSINTIAIVVLSYAAFPGSRRHWRFSAERMREIWAFSRFIAMSSVLTLILMQADKLVLARLMPLEVFGLYGVASQLASAPAALSITYAAKVLLSSYAHAARDGIDELRAIFYPKRRKVGLLYMVSIGLAIGAAPLIVHLLYRPNYYSVTPYFQLLLISTGLRYSSHSARWALIAIGRTSAGFYSQLWSAAWLAVGAVVSVMTHDIFLLVVFVGTSEIPTLLCTWWYLHRERLLSLKSEALELGAAVIGGAIGWAVSDLAMVLWPKL